MRLPLLLSVLCAALALPACADWLVTADGSKIQTRGAWEVRGSLVVFGLPDGSLSSMQLEAVDLDASHDATLSATRAAQEAESEKAQAERASGAKAPVLVLTDRDVAHVDSATEEESEEQETPATRLTVTEWSEDTTPELDGVVVSGTVSNTSSQTLMGAGLVVRIYDSEDGLLATADAQLTARNLAPGAAANFRAQFPAVYSFARVEFEPVGLALETRPTEEAPPPAVPAIRERESGRAG